MHIYLLCMNVCRKNIITFIAFHTFSLFSWLFQVCVNLQRTHLLSQRHRSASEAQTRRRRSGRIHRRASWMSQINRVCVCVCVCVCARKALCVFLPSSYKARHCSSLQAHICVCVCVCVMIFFLHTFIHNK